MDAALDAFARAETINHRRRPKLPDPLRRRANAGQVVYGNVGAPDRLDFTVIGPAVNRAASLESRTKELGVPLLKTAPYAAALGRPSRSTTAPDARLKEPVEEVVLTRRAAL